MLLNTNHRSLIAIMLFSVLAANGQTQPPEKTDAGKTAPKIDVGISAPRLIYSPDPEYSEEARKASLEGTCVLWVVIGKDGNPRDIRVAQKLGLGLDEKAIEAVKNWRFEPSKKDGKPVAVQINVEVTFRLYRNKKILELENKADAGDAKAELKLSSAYFQGRDGLPRNEVRGFELLQRAANRGLAQAQFLMGEHAYADARQEDRQGAGISADYVKAYMWYELALRGGFKQSEERLRELAPKMSPEQVSDAKTQVENWQNTPAK